MEYSQKTQRVLDHAQDIFRSADREERDLSAEEDAEVARALAIAGRERDQKSFHERIGGGGVEAIGNPELSGDLGARFIASAGYKRIADPGTRGQQWTTGAVELGLKGTLLEGAGAPGAGTGGGLVAVPELVPGVVTTLFQRLTVADLLGSGLTSTSTVRYAVEGTATSGAAGVAEGGTKPESTLGLSTVDEPVKKIATSLTTSDELLEDAPATQQFVGQRLGLFVGIEAERQILRGAGTNELVGIVGRSGVTTWARGTVDSNAVALFKAMNGQRGSSFLEPDAIVMNPANWQTTRLGTDTAGQFFGGGPFLGPYGGPQGPVSPSNQVSGALDSIWGKPVIVTSAIGAGTALVGAFAQAATLYLRGGLTVEASNSHDQNFVKDLVAIRAEMRMALGVHRPASFTTVTGLA